MKQDRYTRYLCEWWVKRLAFAQPESEAGLPAGLREARGLWEKAQGGTDSALVLARANELVKAAVIFGFSFDAIVDAAEVFDVSVPPVVRGLRVAGDFGDGFVPTLSLAAEVEVVLARPMTPDQFGEWCEAHPDIEYAGGVSFEADNWEPSPLGDDGFGLTVIGPVG